MTECSRGADHTIDEIYIPSSFLGIITNDDRYHNEKRGGDIKIYVNEQREFEKWIHPLDTKHQGGGFWKVLTPAGYRSEGFGKVFIVEPNETFSQTYIGFRCKNKQQAKNLKQYLETNFANYMLSLRKNTQHISEHTVKWIPPPDLNESWTDEKLRKYFNLT